MIWQLYQPRRRKISKLTQNIAMAGLAVALIAVVALAITNKHSTKTVKVEPTKMVVTGPVIPRATIIQPTGGESATPVQPNGNTLTTTVTVTCPAATSFKAYINSNGKNTITITPPGEKPVRSTGLTPVITTYSGSRGNWHITDITLGSTAGIEWSSNGASCVQG
jgi:hypothetical protein